MIQRPFRILGIQQIAVGALDLMQPLDAAKRPAVQDPPLNHVGLWVEVAEAISALAQERVAG